MSYLMFIGCLSVKPLTDDHWKNARLRTSEALVNPTAPQEGFGWLHWKILAFLNGVSNCSTDDEP